MKDFSTSNVRQNTNSNEMARFIIEQRKSTPLLDKIAKWTLYLFIALVVLTFKF